ncbi:hypothetical protein OE88DRAFT_1656903 [Heliocybe sulcata]|uniref:Uncharacterized protein n=1 Tax=Heliocybe sulcata TaxID=5364 RepID=A0A5C3N7N4_9AGAM|nr:hypothetical protein OE88DRAFT_1656903 [Heliocybe sulcata]
MTLVRTGWRLSEEAFDHIGVHYEQLVNDFSRDKGSLPSWGPEVDRVVKGWVTRFLRSAAKRGCAICETPATQCFLRAQCYRSFWGWSVASLYVDQGFRICSQLFSASKA